MISSSYDFLWALLRIHDSWFKSLTFMIQIYSKFVKSNHTMIKIWSWLKKDEVEENEKLRKIERVINKTTIIIYSCLHFIILITSSTWNVNNVYTLFTRHHCCHLHQLYITYTIYTSSLLSFTLIIHHIYYLHCHLYTL